MNTKSLLVWAAGTAAILAGRGAWANNWPQYRGSAVNSVAAETVPVHEPKKLWSAKTENGFSSFAVADGKAYTIVSRDVDGAPMSMCLAFDANTGKELWHSPTGVAIFQHGGDSGVEGNKGGDGPRSTPAIAGKRVYVYSADMVLYCLDADTGKPIWKHDIAKEFNGQNIGWKSAMSPVLEGGLVYAAGGGPGQSMLAFHADSGE